ncbi:sulfotransferase family protein [uncultured Roseovarius sp.]|uniref:sulfotransferase family protein n=1 Tax=uncultured Roseovarius sp. TaxID=293344 RepID=UPI00261A1E01|nr:sulfotransferase family protein [uncultured Roseovarius sp.]
MTLKVIGTGFGRTGTMSLRMALVKLGFGPCYHMEDVIQDMPKRVPHWNAALDDNPDWDATFDGFQSAVDWPVAAFWQEMMVQYPNAKFILSTRDANSWYKSISQTILAVLTAPEKWPAEQVDWLQMVTAVALKRSLGSETGQEGAINAFRSHEAAVKRAFPAEKLLVFQAADGWEPLCSFLGKPVPDEPYPRSNSREEFFEIMSQNSGN